MDFLGATQLFAPWTEAFEPWSTSKPQHAKQTSAHQNGDIGSWFHQKSDANIAQPDLASGEPTFTVSLLEVSELVVADQAHCCVFTRLEHGDRTFVTRLVKGCANPHWTDTFRLQGQRGCPLNISVHFQSSQNHSGESVSLASLKIPYSSLLTWESESAIWLPLEPARASYSETSPQPCVKISISLDRGVSIPNQAAEAFANIFGLNASKGASENCKVPTPKPSNGSAKVLPARPSPQTDDARAESSSHAQPSFEEEEPPHSLSQGRLLGRDGARERERGLQSEEERRNAKQQQPPPPPPPQKQQQHQSIGGGIAPSGVKGLIARFQPGGGIESGQRDG
eukprot:CAMPEP_0181317820 /NCGR_PEP_ID=MMETSP1101-20121128/16674_1 /TAXON_ID=46948 /ORGANISM="Rhodomonas abbreviata, Strain Caron Lab Isolate" /LENGTH=338 /DNA_ID=CAMNT_0023425243 /DNA_START=137 /DNA_END=1150 /DNA_ORIENTATION=+